MSPERQHVAIVIYPDGRVDAKNAALYCGLSQKTLAMKRCNGTGPKFVKRGRVFYFLTDLDEWLTAGRAVSTAQAMRYHSNDQRVGTPRNASVGSVPAEAVTAALGEQEGLPPSSPKR